MRLVADANVLLSAVLGGRAKLVLQSPQVEQILTTAHTFAEVEEYATTLAERKRLSSDIVLLALAAMPVTIVQESQYATTLRRARKLIGRRDTDDVDILALALHLRLPLWSNDRDFEGTGVELLTTEGALRKLGII